MFSFSFFNTESCYFLSLPSFSLSPFSFLEASRGVKVTGCSQEERMADTLSVRPVHPSSGRHSQLICSFLFIANEALSFKAAWSSPPLPHNTSGCTKKYFPSEVSPLGQAHSAFEWNKNGCTTSGICMLPHPALVTTDRKAAPSEGGPHPRCCVA